MAIAATSGGRLLDRDGRSGEDPKTVRSWSRRVAAGALVLVLSAPGASRGVLEAHGHQARVGEVPASVSASSWFRVFLADGSIISTVGEFTRVDDVVILQVPVGAPGAIGQVETRTVTIAAGEVDWARTDAYRETLRRAAFERSGGERAYAAFTEEVAATLRDVALLPDPLERIRRLETARAELARWPSAHHGYRADEVAQTLSVVDDLLNGMRAAAGQQAFSLELTAGPVTPAPRAAEAALPPPSLQDVIAQALGIAPRLTDAAERLAMLRAAESMLTSAPDLDRRWSRTTRGQVRRQIAQETRVTSRYARLRDWMLERTTRLLAAADVRGLMRVREEVVSRDARLGRQRPAEVASLLATLDMRLDAARRQRLLLERWLQRRPALETFASAVTPHLAPGAALPRALEDIKALSGPEPGLLARAEEHLASARADARLRDVPEDARAAGQIWTSALQLAARAIQGRRSAIRSGDLQQAWEASAAAAGALLLLQQLRTDVPALLRPPSLPAASGP